MKASAKRIAVVTGGSRGIGNEIAKQLAANGFSVVIAARDEAHGKTAAAEINADFIPLDISDESSINEFVRQLSAKYDHVDVLVNNAGIIGKNDHDILAASASLINETFATNSIGPLLLTQALEPLLNAGSRVIMMSSGGGSMSDPVGGWSPVYCVSKSLLNAITRHLAYALSAKKVAVNAMCPGWVRTDMGGRNAPRSVKEGADTAVWLATTEHVSTGKIFRDRKEIPF
jgi:NAD(P)-dependent dehydrogenase (short-subunit alcohol dehydrogenase family)